MPKFIEYPKWDILILFFALVVYYFSFYSKWPLWEDQATYHYIAWGVLNGMRPYAELVENNFPGITLLHMAARLISGNDPCGLRFLDTLALACLCFTSSSILSHWSVSWPIRLVGLSAFLVNYFSTGYQFTAQRESFALPLIVLGVAPFLVSCCFEEKIRAEKWLLFGVIAGLGAWVKPTVTVLLIPAVIYYLTSATSETKKGPNIISYAIGIAIVSAAFLLWLGLAGALPAFVDRAVVHNLTAYQQVKYSWPSRIEHIIRTLEIHYWPTPFLLCAAGLIFRSLLKVRQSNLQPQRYAFFILVVLIFSIFYQGRTSSVYHFIPAQWGLSLFAATLIASIKMPIIRSDVKKALKAFLCIIVITSFIFVGIRLSCRSTLPTPGTLLARDLKPMIKNNESVVAFGFTTATFLSEIERKTPFPHILSWAVFAQTPPGSKQRSKLNSDLTASLRDPLVKYFVVDLSTRPMPINWFQESPSSMLANFIDGRMLSEIGYTKMNLPESKYIDTGGRPYFDVYERK